ncbi:MAG TPA: SDR family oxidoreductase [Ignavibacteriaceae bacterium]|nr:SDR family oxidoreductase [Ignavibacteriaceae bacterium]
MKIFITGGSGLFGQYLNIELSKKNEILTQYNSNIGNCDKFENVKLDLENTVGLENIFSDFNPEVVIHTAAISDPTKAQKMDPKTVYAINVLATEKIAQLCEKYKAKMFYTSTDLVYAGYRGSMLKEDAKLIPVSLYAETKLMGEVKVQQTFNNYIILRTALLYGFGLNHSKCHFDFMYNNLMKGEKVKLFTDQFRTPLSLLEAARMMSELLTKDIRTEIINFGGNERVSRYEFGESLCDAAGFDKNLLVKITMDDVPNLPKVEDVSMSNENCKPFKVEARSISESIKKILEIF